MLAATPVSEPRVVVEALDGWDAAGLKAIASALAAQSRVVAALVSVGDPTAVVVARSQDVAIDAAKTLRTLLDRFGGRGGGRPDLAQGAGLRGRIEEILEVARQLLTA